MLFLFWLREEKHSSIKMQSNIYITKATKKPPRKCSLCGTLIENERCLVIFSLRETPEPKWEAVFIHLGCIDSFIKEIGIVVKEAMLDGLK